MHIKERAKRAAQATQALVDELNKSLEPHGGPGAVTDECWAAMLCAAATIYAGQDQADATYSTGESL